MKKHLSILLLLLICSVLYADTGFLAAVQARVAQLREAVGGLACPSYKQNCISGIDTAPSALICDNSTCANFILSSFAGQGNCNASRCTVYTATQFLGLCQDCIDIHGPDTVNRNACYQAQADLVAATHTNGTESCIATGATSFDWACNCGASSCNPAVPGTCADERYATPQEFYGLCNQCWTTWGPGDGNSEVDMLGCMAEQESPDVINNTTGSSSCTQALTSVGDWACGCTFAGGCNPLTPGNCYVP